MGRQNLTQERIDELVKRHRPRGWLVRQSRRRWFWSSASANWDRRTLYVPTLEDADSLFLYLHEVGHIVGRHFHVKLSKHREEFEAERYALHIFRTENLPITKLIMADIRERLCKIIDHDIKSGVKIQRHIARWAKHGC